jgi:hypothetical protein
VRLMGALRGLYLAIETAAGRDKQAEGENRKASGEVVSHTEEPRDST